MQKFWWKVDPSRLTNPKLRMKIADPVLLSLFWEIMKSATSLTLRLEWYSILNTKCIGVIDPEGPEKYNNTEIKSGRLFTAATQHLTPTAIALCFISPFISYKNNSLIVFILSLMKSKMPERLIIIKLLFNWNV